MSRHQTYRVVVSKTEVFEIDLVAADETRALREAERLWNGGIGNRFVRDETRNTVSFAIDEHAALRFHDVANEDRARWARTALQAFSHQTKSDMGQEALHDLLCDLGHYAHSIGIDFRDEIGRAADVCEAEIAEAVLS